MFKFLGKLFKSCDDIKLVPDKRRDFRELSVVRHRSADEEVFKALVGGFRDHHAAFDLNTDLRIAHFWAQITHESDQFKTLKEYGGPRYFRRYEHRKDLGNTSPGDGVKYFGRGVIQITGKYNYRKFGKKLGIDIVKNPELAEEPETAMLIALLYWKDRGLNTYADKDDIRRITKRINGGYNGLKDRQRHLDKLKREFNI